MLRIPFPVTTYRDRSRIIALGASLVVPGGGHFYVGQARHGFMLSAAFVAGIMLTLALASSGLAAIGLVLSLAVISFDLFRAQRLLKR